MKFWGTKYSSGDMAGKFSLREKKKTTKLQDKLEEYF